MHMQRQNATQPRAGSDGDDHGPLITDQSGAKLRQIRFEFPKENAIKPRVTKAQAMQP
jgi:hypothetical protein